MIKSREKHWIHSKEEDCYYEVTVEVDDKYHTSVKLEKVPADDHINRNYRVGVFTTNMVKLFEKEI